MAEYKLIEDSIEVPKNTGKEGFLHTIREILYLPRVQNIFIDSKGKVSYKRYIMNGESPTVSIDFEGLQPWHIVRNGEVEELQVGAYSAAVIITSLLDRVVEDKLRPIAFVLGANSVFWDWYSMTTGAPVDSREYICGLPIYTDRQTPDSALILCGAYTERASLIDTQKSYKVEMIIPVGSAGPDTLVEVF